MMRTIAIVNQKGGVGKSVTAVKQDKLPITIATLMERTIEDEAVLPTDGVLHHNENIDLIPANIELSGMEVTLVNTMSRESILREYLKILRIATILPFWTAPPVLVW